MKVYDVYLNNQKIGVLRINEKEKYSYEVDEEGLKKLSDTPIFYQLKESTDGFVDPIPVFYNRITNCKRFGKENEIGYFGDDLKLVLKE